jgi:DNA polymerase-3 subunit alpha
MDCLNPNRNQLMHDLEFVLDWAQSRARDKASGQGNLFDLFGSAPKSDEPAPSVFDTAPKAPPVDDFPSQEKLKLEKELLGFYISDHPLKSVQDAARILAPINLSDLAEQAENVTLSAIVMLSSVKPVTTKKGDRMAIIQIEDLTGQAEAVVFPKSFERIGALIQPDARLMVWGKVDRRDDRSQFIVEDAEPIEDIQLVMVELEPKIASDITYQHQLRTVLLENRGDEDKCKVPVVAVISNQRRREIVRLGAQFRVQDHHAAVSALQRAGFSARAATLVGA